MAERGKHRVVAGSEASELVRVDRLEARAPADVCQEQRDLRKILDDNRIFSWQSGLCSCLSVKDAGCACCVKVCVGAPCIWGDATQAAGFDQCCPVCCIALMVAPCCTLSYARCVVSDKYSLGESHVASVAQAATCGLQWSARHLVTLTPSGGGAATASTTTTAAAIIAERTLAVAPSLGPAAPMLSTRHSRPKRQV